MELVEVKNEKDLAVLMPLLKEIWSEVFTPIIGADQVAYMLANYQSQANIEDDMKKGAHYFLLVYDSKPVGYTAYEENEEEVYLSKLYLHANTRGKGFSSQVFDWYEQLAKGKRLYLNVNQGNTLAISVYEHRGFTRAGERYVDIGQGFIMNDYIYEKLC